VRGTRRSIYQCYFGINPISQNGGLGLALRLLARQAGLRRPGGGHSSFRCSLGKEVRSCNPVGLGLSTDALLPTQLCARRQPVN
jgi:hypothetical protein